MKALQVLVAARAMGSTWVNTAVTMRLDCLALVHTLRKGYHQHDAVDAIMQELANLQIRNNFSLRPMWVRRCWNEAADALSKNDMERFWSNVEGDRTLIKLEPHHLAPPLSDSIRGLVPGKLRPQRRGRKAPGIDELVAQGGLRERQN